MADPFEPERYLRVPVMDVPTAITFAQRLAAVAPRKPPPTVKKGA